MLATICGYSTAALGLVGATAFLCAADEGLGRLSTRNEIVIVAMEWVAGCQRSTPVEGSGCAIASTTATRQRRG